MQEAKGAKGQEAKAKAKVKPTKRFWFETYKWFITSSGATGAGRKGRQSPTTRW